MRQNWLVKLAIVALIMQNILTATVQAQPVSITREWVSTSMVCTSYDCSYAIIPYAEEPSVSKTSDAAQIEKQAAAERHTAQRVGAALGLLMTASQWSSWASLLAPIVLRVLPFLPHSLAGAMGLAPALVGALLLGQIVHSSVSSLIYALTGPNDKMYVTDSGSVKVRIYPHSFDFFYNHIREISGFLWPTELTEGWTIKNFSENIGWLLSSYVSTIAGVTLVGYLLLLPSKVAQMNAEDEHEADMARRIAEDDARKARINAEQEADRDRRNAEQEADGARIIAEQEADRARINTERDALIARHNAEHEENMAQRNAEHEENMARHNAEHEENMAQREAFIAQFDADMAEIRENRVRHDANMAEAQARHEANRAQRAFRAWEPVVGEAGGARPARVRNVVAHEANRAPFNAAGEAGGAPQVRRP